MPTPQALLDNIVTGSSLTSGNMELIPLLRSEPANAAIDYILAAKAIDQSALRVAEVDDDGSVSELLAISEADVAILLLDGEELIGAMQNRILNTDVLLRPHAKKMIPVSCVEQGRWHHTGKDFVAGTHAPPPIRARKSRSVGRNLRESSRASSDQGEVWDGVEGLLGGMEASSETSAMSDAFEQRKDDLDLLVEGLPYPEGAVGVVVLINGQFAALDLFAQPSTVQEFWPRLVVGYAADAATRTNKPAPTTTTLDATTVLDRLRGVDCAVCPGVDLGEDWRFDSSDLVGSALVVEDIALHLSAFPSDPDRRAVDANQGRIASPSRRRRRRRGEGRRSGATRHQDRRPPCPRCGAEHVVPIVYGLPAQELFERAERGEVELGGCCIGENDPDSLCRECNHKWRAKE